MDRLEAMFNEVPADGAVPDGLYEVAIEKQLRVRRRLEIEACLVA